MQKIQIQRLARIHPKYNFIVNNVPRGIVKPLIVGYFYSKDSSKQCNLKVDKVLNIYKELALNPTLASTRILSAVKDRITLQSEWLQKNLELRRKQKFIQSFTFDENLQLVNKSFPLDISSELMSTQSNDENLKAILRKVMVDGKSKQFIEIWNKENLMKSYDLSAFGVHGSVYSNAIFGAFHFSPDNNRLLYIAEKKLPKSEPFYKQNRESVHKSDESDTRGTEYIFKPDWGDMLTGKHRSAVVVLNIADDTIVPIDSIPDDYFPSQVTWSPNGDIVGVAYKLYPRYLGAIVCTNRKSYVFHLKGSEFYRLTTEGLACRSPCFSPDGKYLVWLERDITPLHHTACRLASIKWDSMKEPEILIDVVKTDKTIKNGKKFYGLFNLHLAKRCWSEDSKYLFFSTPSRSTIKSYVLDLGTKEITEINNDDESSLTVLDVRKNDVAFRKSSLTQPHQLVVGRFNPSQDIGNVHLLKCTTPHSNSELEKLVSESSEFVYDNNDSIKNFNFIYLGKKDAPKKSMPAVLIVHGGPHTSRNNEFSLPEALLARLGFGVLLINYRGSAGMGEDNVEYVRGKIGNSDVLDCVTLLNAALAKYPWLDSDKITLWSSSYGGFIGAHLSGQYPDKFKAVVLENPVIEIASLFFITDSPDWCSSVSKTEDLGKIPETVPTANYFKIIQKMLSNSPILHAHKVKAPTFIAVGENDQTVPLSQGKLWYYRLTASNVNAKLHVYNDNHSLTKNEETDIDYIINSALWLVKHTNTEI